EAPGEQRRRQRQRIMAGAIAVFGDEKIVPDQQRIHHRSRRDVEGLEQEGADDQRDDEGMNDDPDGLADAALFALFFTGHAHWPLSFVCRTRHGSPPDSDALSACPQGPLDRSDASSAKNHWITAP